MMLDQLGRNPSHKVQFFSFSQDRDSILNSPDGRSRLQEVGIRTTTDVGDWLADTFEQQLDQDQFGTAAQETCAQRLTFFASEFLPVINEKLSCVFLYLIL